MRRRDGFDEIDVHTEESIIESVQQSLGTSIRRRLTPTSKVFKVLKKENFHPFHYKKVQSLQPGENVLFSGDLYSVPWLLPINI